MAITVLVRNAASRHEGCRILYHDIGDYLKREEKLAILRNAESIAGMARANQKSGWSEIMPDEHHDWIGQRDQAFQDFYPMGTKEAKAGKADDAVFRLYSRGYATSRDAYTYNLSRTSCAANAAAMVRDYMGAIVLRERRPDYEVEDVVASIARMSGGTANSRTTYGEAGVLPIQRRRFVGLSTGRSSGRTATSTTCWQTTNTSKTASFPSAIIRTEPSAFPASVRPNLSRPWS